VDDLALVTDYMFLVTMLSMAAASAFFWTERDTLAPNCRSACTLAGMYTSVAAFVYWRMTSMVGGDGDPASVIALPTHYRYVDWVITTPLIVLSLFVLLQAANERRRLAMFAIAADIAMIVFGYFGEINLRNPESRGLAWAMFGLGCAAFLVLLYVMYGPLARVAATRPEVLQRAYARMRRFIALAWPIYPLCFAVAAIAPGDEVKIARELIYNIADLLNKIGLGVLALAAARETTEALRAEKPVA
jgi:sensory rhodopsin